MYMLEAMVARRDPPLTRSRYRNSNRIPSDGDNAPETRETVGARQMMQKAFGLYD